MKPIIFSGPMVNAIMDGRKTQTRRIVKDQTVIDAAEVEACIPLLGQPARIGPSEIGRPVVGAFCPSAGYAGPKLSEVIGWGPYGAPGGQLWVRETWGTGTRPCPREGWVDGIEYRADDVGLDEHDILPLYQIIPDDVEFDSIDRSGWRPSIHMPKWACRLYLTITDIRVERLQDISSDDCIAEGTPKRSRKAAYPWHVYAQEDFEHLWDSINGKKHPWADNEWVWVISFSRVDDVQEKG